MEILKSVLSTIAPGLATIIGGPMAGILTGFLSKMFLGTDNGSAIDIAVALKDPANFAKLKELDQQWSLALLASQDRDKDRQTDINKIEAAAPELFKSGWRPFLGWGLGIILVVYCLLMTVLSTLVAFHYDVAVMPALDPMVRDTLMGMLGLTIGARTFEKIKGKN